LRLPKPTNRTVVIGSTGSGKTQFSVWLLTTRDFQKRPWVIIDFKGDELLEDIGAKKISVQDYPKEPGLYIMSPLPGDDDFINQFFYRCWANENIGVFIDEGYMLPPTTKHYRWFAACLTQGRSKHIEIITCTQRPVKCDKFVFTQANFIAVFNMNYKDDRKIVSAYLNDYQPSLLPRFHCLWYDVDEQKQGVFSPVPEAHILMSAFDKKLDNSPMKI